PQAAHRTAFCPPQRLYPQAWRGERRWDRGTDGALAVRSLCATPSHARGHRVQHTWEGDPSLASGVPPGSKRDTDAEAEIVETLIVVRESRIRQMVVQGRHADPACELIPHLDTLAEQEPGAQALAPRRRGVERPIVRGATQA